MRFPLINNHRFLLIILILYSLLFLGFTLNYASVFYDEALNITMGWQILNNEACPTCSEYTGFSLIYPVIATTCDSIGGLYGARAFSTLFGIMLALVIYITSRTLFSEKHGILSAAILLFSGTTLYLCKLATYDILTAFFVGLSFLFVVISEKKQPSFFLLAGAVTLFLASITQYVAFIYIFPFLVYVFWKQRLLNSILFFFLPLLVLLAIYGIFIFYPDQEALFSNIAVLYNTNQVPFDLLSNSSFRWMAMPYLLAVFGLFHKEYNQIALVLFIMSTPIILLHLLSGVELGIHKNFILALVIITPVSALGICHMSSLFSTNITAKWVKPYFIVLVLCILWVFGITELKWLEKYEPDVSEVIELFQKNGFDGMTVLIDSRYKKPEYVYQYSLSKTFPKASFLSMSYMREKNKSELLKKENPDFLIMDEFYGGKTFSFPALKHIYSGNYYLFYNGKIKLSWMSKKIMIYARRE